MWPRFREQSSNWFCRIGLGLGIGTILVILALNHRAVDPKVEGSSPFGLVVKKPCFWPVVYRLSYVWPTDS
jgi:hypothetical protein